MRQTVLIIIFALALTTITIGQTMRVFKEHDKELEDLIQFFNKNAFQADTGVYLSEIDNTGKIVSSKVFTVALNRMIYGLSYAHFIDSSYLGKKLKSQVTLLLRI